MGTVGTARGKSDSWVLLCWREKKGERKVETWPGVKKGGEKGRVEVAKGGSK